MKVSEKIFSVKTCKRKEHIAHSVKDNKVHYVSLELQKDYYIS